MLAGGGAVGAGAGWGGGQGHGVHVPSGAEDEEVGIEAVEEAEGVMEGSRDPVGDRLRGFEQVRSESAVRRRIGSDGFHCNGS